jgi:hypothetical protein
MAIFSKSAPDIAPESGEKRAFTEPTTSEIEASARTGRRNGIRIRNRKENVIDSIRLGQDHVGARGKSPLESPMGKKLPNQPQNRWVRDFENVK